jgi:hypothetical protein
MGSFDVFSIGEKLIKLIIELFEDVSDGLHKVLLTTSECSVWIASDREASVTVATFS